LISNWLETTASEDVNAKPKLFLELFRPPVVFFKYSESSSVHIQKLKTIKTRKSNPKLQDNANLKCIKPIFSLTPNGKICMSLLADVASPYLGAFVTGLLYGLAYCTASCLPVVASYIAGVGLGFRQSIKITVIFNGGRIVAYTMIGMFIALFSGLMGFFVSESAITPFQVYSSIIFGVVTIIVGAMLMWQTRKRKTSYTCKTDIPRVVTRIKRYGIGFGAFALGFTRGIVICAPLILMLTASLTLVDPLGSVAIAALFGIGTSISPILVLGGVTGWLLEKAPLFRKWISIAGGIVLILIGFTTVYSSIIQMA